VTALGIQQKDDASFSFMLVFQISFIHFSTNILVYLAALSRMKMINKLLLAELESFEEADELVKEVSKIYSKFSDTMKLLNKCFGFTLMLKICEILFHCTFISFSVFNIVFYDPSEMAVAYFITGTNFIFLIACLDLPLIICSCLIKRENSRISLSLLDFQQRSFERFGADCSLAINFPEVLVSCGLFEVDLNFVFTMATAVLSNLIILIQFNMIEKENPRT
jgi:hypothetical protein